MAKRPIHLIVSTRHLLDKDLRTMAIFCHVNLKFSKSLWEIVKVIDDPEAISK